MTFPRSWIRVTSSVADRVALRLAGHAAVADLEHVGRRSGIVRHTPVRAFRVGDHVVIGLNFGRTSDWYRNIAAAGGCRMRLGDRRFTLGPPELVPVDQGIEGMPRVFGAALKHVVRTKECVRLPIVVSVPAA